MGTSYGYACRRHPHAPWTDPPVTPARPPELAVAVLRQYEAFAEFRRKVEARMADPCALPSPLPTWIDWLAHHADHLGDVFVRDEYGKEWTDPDLSSG